MSVNSSPPKLLSRADRVLRPPGQTMTDLSDKRVTVAGLGRFGGGIAVSRWLVQQGARVLVTDQAKLIRMPIHLRYRIENTPENDKSFRIIGRTSAGVGLFDVSPGETIVSAVLLDEQEEPENEAEELIVEEMAARGSPETGPEPTPDRDEGDVEE